MVQIFLCMKCAYSEAFKNWMTESIKMKVQTNLWLMLLVFSFYFIFVLFFSFRAFLVFTHQSQCCFTTEFLQVSEFVHRGSSPSFLLWRALLHTVAPTIEEVRHPTGLCLLRDQKLALEV